MGSEVESRFDAVLKSLCERTLSEAGHNAKEFRRMLQQMGGLRTARHLIHKNQVSTGFVALWERKRLDLTVENEILQPEWHSLFEDEDRKLARDRLEQYEFTPAIRTGPSHKPGPTVPTQAKPAAVAGQAEFDFDVLLNRLTRHDVLGAIAELDRGAEHDFTDSKSRDLVYKRRRYTVRSVIAFAARRHLGGRLMTPDDFSGWQDTKSVPALTALGFTIRAKSEAAPDDDSQVFVEGREKFRLHRVKERNRQLIAEKKRRVLAKLGKLSCECCDFDFVATYGSLGQGFAECHHRVPLAELTEAHRIRISELAIVCANCHRMLHREQGWTVERLRRLVLLKRG